MISDIVFRTVELSDPEQERDGLRFATVKSHALGRRADVSLWIPPAREIDNLLILLHGVYGSHWVWSMKAGVHRIAQSLLDAGEISPIMIAMPSDGLGRDGSAYLNHPHAENAEAWIVDEVPAIARLAAPALRADARIAIAGLSMGGYGALMLGSKYAQRFRAVAAHSAITNINEMAKFVEEPMSEYLIAPEEQLDPLYWMKRNRAQLPPLRFDCGTADPLLSGNRVLHKALEQENIPHHYQEFAGGHEWSYWQTHIAATLRFVQQTQVSS